MTHSVYPAPAGLFLPDAVLDALGAGLLLLAPGYAVHDPITLATLDYVSANAVAQRLLGLPAQPTGAFDTLGAQATALFAFFCDTFQTGEAGQFAPGYVAANGSHWQVVAQRYKAQLVVSFTETRERPAPTEALVLAQQAAQAASHLLAQEQAVVWQRLFERAPVAIALLWGPQHVLEQANAASWALWDHSPAQALNQPLFQALPELADQGLEQHLDEVLATGQPYLALARPTFLNRGGHLEAVYLDIICQPIYGPYDRLEGVTFAASDVSAQVVAHHQVQELNEELNASNEEYRASNHALAHTQSQLQLLNHELTARVAAGVKEAQLARADAERQRQRLERLFEQSPAAISILGGPDLVYELVNPEYQALFPGRPLLGLSLQEAHPETASQGINDRLHEVYKTGGNYTGNERLWQVPHPDDGHLQDLYIDYLYQARYDEYGAVDGVLIFALNVTAQVQARAQMQRFNQELEARVQVRTQEAEAARAEAESQRWQLAAIIEQAPVAITYITGPDVRVTAINPAACRLLGCNPPDVLHRPLQESFPRLHRFADLLREVMRTQVPVREREAEAQLERDGQLLTVYFDLAYQPLVNEQGETTGVLSIAADTTEQVLARRQVQQLNAELEARVAAGIEEAQQARADAERRRERLERFFAQAPAAVCVLDGPELVFESVNPGFQNLFPSRPLLGLPVLEALPEFRELPLWQQMQRVYATGETNEETNRLIPLAQYTGGPLRDFYFHYVQQARYNAQGRIDGVLVFALDITAQVRVQQLAERLQEQVLAAVQHRAQEREAFYQIFAQTPAAVALMRGPDHRFEYVNQACEQLFLGRPLRGLPILEALPETGPQGFVALLEQAYRTGETVVGTEVPLLVTPPDGKAPTTKWMSFTFQAYREQGVIVGVSVFAYDVTVQVQARQQREAGLAQLHAIFEQAPVGLAQLTGPDYVVEVANPAICAMWGRERPQVLGQPLFAVLPEVVDQGIPEIMAEVRRTGQPFVAEERSLHLLRYGRRDTVYFQFVYQPLADAQGQVTAIVVVATDVSARVLSRQQLAQANEELRTTNAQLTHTNTDLDNFIYTASHDLKAPIANIEGLLLLLRKQLPTAAQQQGLVPRVLGMMQESVERFQQTIGHLTDLTRLQQVRTEPTQTVELAAVVEAVRLDLAPMLEATSTRLTVDIQDCATVQFAPQHLRSIVYNLLSNAVKYRHPDRVPEVQLRCRPAAHATLLEVQDNGLGLSQLQQSKLFTLFQRLHAHVDGSGVGLYMVKRIVENVGGTISVHSEPDVGSTFTVSFPA